MTQNKISTFVSASLIALACMPGATALAQTVPPAYYQVAREQTQIRMLNDSELTQEDLLAAQQQLTPPAPSENFSFFQDASPWSLVITGVQMAWNFILANRPAAHLDQIKATALPNIAKDHFELLTGWKPMRTLLYKSGASNPFGMSVIELEYKIRFSFGGSYKKMGQYISAVSVAPSKIKVNWGFKLDARAVVVSIVNMRTENDPLAAIRIDTSYTLSSPIKSENTTQSFLFIADGTIQNLKTGEVYCGPVPR